MPLRVNVCTNGAQASARANDERAVKLPEIGRSKFMVLGCMTSGPSRPVPSLRN